MDKRHTAVLGLGSNLGQPVQILQAAWNSLGLLPDVVLVRLSSPYRSKPIGMESSHWFINAVGIVRTSLSPLALLHALQTIEISFGRRRDPAVAGYQDRTLDLDLLLYDERVLATPELTLPHPRMDARRFVLEPLGEIAADVVSSPFSLSVRQWVDHCLATVNDQPVERCSWTHCAP